MQRNRSVSGWSVLKVGLGILLAAAALDGSGRLASADPTTTPAPAATDTTDEAAVEPPAEDIRRPPNTLYGADDAIQLEDLSPAEQEGVLDTQEGDGARYPDSVASAYSAYARQAAADAEVQRAAQQSGTSGLDEVGVLP